MARPIKGERPPSYVSKATLAAELDVSETTVDDYVRRGLLPKPIHLGGSVRWNWALVQASLDPLAGAGGLSGQDPYLAGLKNVAPSA
jgi:predicted DNA-binding transcriptional regulator AlpA